MDVSELLIEFLDRIPDAVGSGLDGLDAKDLTRAPGEANPAGWLGWHLARVLDDHVAGAFGTEQVWVAGGWAPRFGFAAGAMDIGYGHTPAQVRAVAPERPQVILDYLFAVHSTARELIAGVDADALDRVVDPSYDPPVTLGVRLVSVVEDCLQHAGQLGYLRGLLRAE